MKNLTEEKLWPRRLLRTALKLGGNAALKKIVWISFSSDDVKIFRWRIFYWLNDFDFKEKLACFDALCLQIFKSMTIVQFCSFKWIFLKASFNSKLLIQTPVERQFTQTRRPPMGERSRSAAPLIHRLLKKKSGLWIVAVNASTVWEGMRAPAPFPRPPPRGSVSCHRLRRARFGANWPLWNIGTGVWKKQIT
jgi:hypothetical protein